MENNNELYVKSVKDFFTKIREYGERDYYDYTPKDLDVVGFDSMECNYSLSGRKEYINVKEIIDANKNNELVEKILNDKELMIMAIDEYPDLAKYIGYDLKKDLNFLNRALSTSLKDYNQLDTYKDIRELRLSLVESFDNNFEPNNKKELSLKDKIAEIARKRQEDKLKSTNRMTM